MNKTEDIFAAMTDDDLATLTAKKDAGAERQHTRANGNAKTKPLHTITPLSWTRPAPLRKWVAYNRIPQYFVSALYGDGGAGKTTIALQLCCARARGAPDWLGAVIEPGCSLFYSAEEPEDEIQRRIEDIAAEQGFSLSELGDLHLHFPEDDGTLATLDRRSGLIKPTAEFLSLKKTIDEIRPSLVVVDSKVAVALLDGNVPSAARGFINLFKGLTRGEHKTTVLLLDHPSLSGMNDSSGRSGTVDWNNAVRARMYLSALSDKTKRDDTLRQLEVKKNNYGPSGEIVQVQWRRGCYRMVPEQTSLDRLSAEADVDRVFMQLLDLHQGRGEDVSSKNSRSGAAHIFAEHPKAEGIDQKAFWKAQERLIERGAIEVKNYGPPSHRKNRLVRGNTQERTEA